MATIPNVADIQRRVPTGSQPIATIRNAGAIGDGASSVGSGLSAAAQAAENYQDKRTVREVTTANTGFTLDEFEIGNSFDQDEDYGTMVDRYNKAVGDKIGERANTIGDARERASFMERAALRGAEGSERIKDKAFGVETDFERAKTVTNLEGLREMVIKGNGAEAIEAAEQEIQSAMSLNYIGEEEGTLMLEKFKQDSSIAWIESLPPEQRVEQLNSEMADNLPSDARAKLLRAAETANVASTAEGIVQSYFDDETYDRERMITESDKITDEKVQSEVRRRYANRLADEAAATLKQESEMYDAYHLPISMADTNPATEKPWKVADIPREDLNNMSPAQRNNLFAAEGLTAGRRTKRSNPEVIDQLNILNETQQWGDLRQYFIDNSNDLTASDFDTWSQRSVDGVVPDSYDSLFTELETMKSKITRSGLTGNDYNNARAAITDDLTVWHHRVWKETDKSPTDKMVESKIDNLLIDVVTDYGVLWNSTKRMYEMSDSDLSGALTEAQEEDIVRYEKIRAIVDPDTQPAEFLEAFQRATF